MTSRTPVLRFAFLVVSALLAFSGCDCGRECTVPSDCPGGQTCQSGVCVDIPDGGQTCSPACPISQFCDQASLTCKNCDGTLISGTQQNRGCTASQPICDTSANGGLGQCRSCAPTSTDGGVDPGCSGSAPICDPTLSAGNGACITCNDRGGCGAGRVCDTSVSGGACRTCLASTDGGVAPGCTTAEPICNVAQNRCIVCTSAQGCGGSLPYCNPTANGGKGTCNACLPSTGGTATGCTAEMPVCNPAGGGGTGACVVCTGTAGCTSPQFCNTAAAAGSGQCVTCLDTSGSGTDQGCSSGSPVCDVAVDGGTCLGCLSSTDCATPPNLVCDTSVNRCKVCVLLPDPEGCGPSQVCDPTANGGQGACLGCVGDADCLQPDGGASATPRCRTAPPPGVCVECVDNLDCTNPVRPACNANDVCGCTTSPDCSGSTPVCDSAANNGNGLCVVCTATEGCTSRDAPFCSGGTACICRGNEDCDLNKVCAGSPASCQPITQDNTGIPAFLAAAVGPVAVPINDVYVTYIKPQVGSLTNDPAGFFVQAVADGPAMFVAVDPGMVNGGGATIVGDRVSFTATSKQLLSGIDTANIVTGFTVVSTGHPTHNLDTATPAGLVVDRSAASDLVTALDSYESEIVRLTGTITGAFAAAGSGHSGATFDTAGVTGNTNLQIRLPDTLIAQLDLITGCQLTLLHGPVWRFNARAQPTAYSAADISGLSCPAPRVLSAIAFSDTSVEITFDRLIDPASVQATDFSIPGLTVSDAQTNGRQVTLTTSAQTPDAAYTVTVTGVADTTGTAVDPAANTATFYGYVGPQVGLVINEVDYDQPSTDSAEFIELTNIGTTSVSISGLEVLLVNGGNTATPRREYARFPLSQVTDGTNPVTQVPPGGVVVLGSASVISGLAPGTLRMQIQTSGATPDQNIIQNGGISSSPQSDGLGIIHSATGTMIDALFYETSTQASTFDILTGAGDVQLDFEEGTRTDFEDSGTAAASVQRKKTGTPAAPQDTNDNITDFELATTPTPGVQ